jgi:hypothetical protein
LLAGQVSIKRIAMPLRLRLFVKKRGSRRTSSRWQGMLGEAVLDLVLLAAGSSLLYWFGVHFLFAEDADYSWWPWLVSIIPLALVVYGVVGLGVLVWQSMTSAERRAAVAQRASEWDLTAPVRSDRPNLPTLPPIDAIVDSPGVQLAYRLPIDAASGWVSATMAAVCLAWNTLVAVFVVQVIRSHIAGHPNWLLTWLMVPFVMAGVWTLVALARQVLMTTFIGTTRLEVSAHPFYPGGRYDVYVSQTGRLKVRWLQVQLICEEQAVYQQGTDTRRAAARVYRDILYSGRKFDIAQGSGFETRCSFAVPSGAMHSFIATHNAIQWWLVVRGRLARWGDIERRFPVYIYPGHE